MTLIFSDTGAVNHREYTYWRDVLACTDPKGQVRHRGDVDYISRAM